MDPITFIIWMWITWGCGRLFFPGDTSPADVAGEERPVSPTPDDPGFWKRAASGDYNARTPEWSSAGWWLGSLLGAVVAPFRDVRASWSWFKGKRRDRDEQDDDRDRRDRDEQDDRKDDRDDRKDDDDRRDDRDEQDDRRDDDRDRDERRDDKDDRDRDEKDDRRDRDDRPEPYDIEVDVIRVRPNTPPTPELGQPPRALTAGEQPQTAPEPEPEPTQVEIVRTDTPEGTEDMAGNYVAVPGSTGVARNAGGGAVSTGGNTHDAAKAFSKKIVTAIETTADPVARAQTMLDISLKAAWVAVESLQEAGIAGAALEKWCEAVVTFGIARETARVLAQQVDAAKDAAAAASRYQTRTGDKVQAAIVAAGKSAAKHTAYYDKS